jgi:hypothetical protein
MYPYVTTSFILYSFLLTLVMLVGDIPDPYLPLQYQLTGSHLPGHPQGQLESGSHHFQGTDPPRTRGSQRDVVYLV